MSPWSLATTVVPPCCSILPPKRTATLLSPCCLEPSQEEPLELERCSLSYSSPKCTGVGVLKARRSPWRVVADSLLPFRLEHQRALLITASPPCCCQHRGEKRSHRPCSLPSPLNSSGATSPGRDGCRHIAAAAWSTTVEITSSTLGALLLCYSRPASPPCCPARPVSCRQSVAPPKSHHLGGLLFLSIHEGAPARAALPNRRRALPEFPNQGGGHLL